MLYQKMFPKTQNTLVYSNRGKPKKNFDADTVANAIERYEAKRKNKTA